VKLKRLPQPALFGLMVAAAAIVLGAGWMLLVSPQRHKVSDLHKQTLAVQQEIADDLARSAAAKSAVSTVPKIRVAPIYKLAKAMPSLTDMPDLLLELNQTASAAGVSLTSIAPGSPTSGLTDYSTIPIALSVTGDFYSITDLIYRLRNLVSVRNGTLEANGRLFAIDSVNLSPSGGNKVSASINVETYVYSPAATAPVPAPTAPGTTTPASTTPASGPSAAGGP
jgi:type IV pilus assembly protein PilO